MHEVRDLNKAKFILRNFYNHMNAENRNKFKSFIIKKEKKVIKFEHKFWIKISLPIESYFLFEP